MRQSTQNSIRRALDDIHKQMAVLQLRMQDLQDQMTFIVRALDSENIHVHIQPTPMTICE